MFRVQARICREKSNLDIFDRIQTQNPKDSTMHYIIIPNIILQKDLRNNASCTGLDIRILTYSAGLLFHMDVTSVTRKFLNLKHWMCSVLNTLGTGFVNCLNARSRGLTFRHRASCI